MDTPLTTVSNIATRQPGHHTFQHIMRVIREGKLGQPRHWVDDRGDRQKLTVTMPDERTNLRITRSPKHDYYDVGPEAQRPSEAKDPVFLNEVLTRISAFYAQERENNRLIDGHLSADAVTRILASVREMPCNRSVGTEQSMQVGA